MSAGIAACVQCRRDFAMRTRNQVVCGEDCRKAHRRAHAAEYWKSEAGRSAQQRYRRSEKRTASLNRWLETDQAKGSRASYAKRRYHEDPHLRERNVLNHRVAYRRLRESVIREERACRACGATKALTLDHIVPLRLGGTNDRENLQALCRPCNSRKKLAIVEYAPPVAVSS